MAHHISGCSPLPVELCHLLQEGIVLQKDRACNTPIASGMHLLSTAYMKYLAMKMLEAAKSCVFYVSDHSEKKTDLCMCMGNRLSNPRTECSPLGPAVRE